MESVFTETITLNSCLLCIIVSIVLGVIISLTYKTTSEANKNFLITLVILPLLVQTIIFLVNGNLGTAFAVAGAFSLIRFRSIPGSSKEILFVFWAMTVGLGLGMGYIGYTILITICTVVVVIILNNFMKKTLEREKYEKQLKIIIPENLDYDEVFDEVLKKYAIKSDLIKIKTTNLGSMYELLYNLTLKPKVKEKELIDEIRCRNGNMLVKLERKDTYEEQKL